MRDWLTVFEGHVRGKDFIADRPAERFIVADGEDEPVKALPNTEIDLEELVSVLPGARGPSG